MVICNSDVYLGILFFYFDAQLLKMFYITSYNFAFLFKLVQIVQSFYSD